MILFLAGLLLLQADDSTPWTLRTIDNSSQGADGVRPGDIDGDGRLDLVSAWEEGGVIRVYRNPGKEKVKHPWPKVTVGKVAAPEDAVYMDVDGDGVLDVVRSCEGKTRSIFVHLAPADRARLMEEGAWRTQALPAARNRLKWMFALPFDATGNGRADLVAGGKRPEGRIGYFRAPEDRSNLKEWAWQDLAPVGWLMSILPDDVDGDGDLDLIFSDRKTDANRRGVRWLENPGKDGGVWKDRFIGARNREIMFLSMSDVDGDGRKDILGAVRGGPITILRRTEAGTPAWELREVPLPENIGTGKSVGAADMDHDGQIDLVLTCENAKEGASGVVMLSPGKGGAWRRREISGPVGVKFDLVQLLDLDEDGDLDVLTCEERHGLGVIWYENPLR